LGGAVRLVGIAVLLAVLACGGHPSDEEIREQLAANREGFESVLSMLAEDPGVTRIDDSWYAPEGSLTDQRLAEYRSILEQIDVPRGVAIFRRSGTVEFLVSPLGLATGGSTKGLAHSEKPPDGPRFESLDSRPVSLPKLTKGYVPLGAGWYIFYTWDD